MSATAAPPKRSRAWLLLWIGVPVVIVVVLAAILVPGMVRSANARAAADQYQQQKKAWSKTFDAKALAPLASMEPAAFGTAYVAHEKTIVRTVTNWSAPKADEVAKLCSGYAALAKSTSRLDATAPVLERVEGGEVAPEYAAAAKDAKRNAAAYRASDALAKDAKESFAVVAQACDYALAENGVEIAAAKASNAYRATFTRKKGEGETIRYVRRDAFTSTRFWQECESDGGCLPVMDMAKRGVSANAWDAFIKADMQGYADVFAKHCPDAMKAACEVGRKGMTDTVELGLAVGTHLREDDPRKVSDAALSSGASVFAAMDAAKDVYSKRYLSTATAIGTELDKTFGTTDWNTALSKLVADALQQVRSDAEAVSTP